MEVVIPAAPTMDFDFNSARSTPYPSAPSSPKRFGQFLYTSAPTSPSRISEFYKNFDDLYTVNGSEDSRSSCAIPFGWEEKPGTPKSAKGTANTEDDFAFNFRAELEKDSLTAEELFDGGKIRSLKLPPRLQLDEFTTQKSPLLSPRSPRSSISFKKMIREALSPRGKKKADPFATVNENTRGRERRVDISSSSRRATRSLSPYRVSEYPWEEEKKHQQQQNTTQNSSSKPHQPEPQPSKGSSKRWRLRDFLLFRSASEGRTTDKDPFSKYSVLFKRNEDTRNSSSRSIDGSGSVSSTRRKGRVSAHELHYTKNKAASQDLKKKTFLPYKQGILGRVAVNPAVHALANGFGTLKRS